MFLEKGMKFVFNGNVFEIRGQGSTVHHLQIRDKIGTYIDLHIDEFNRLYDNGEIELL